jgi:polyphosphate kinase
MLHNGLQGARMSGRTIQSGGLTVPGEPMLFFNRELSWLAFNQRVLAEARNLDYPLFERLRFLSISGSNLDEFMTVRVAGLAGQARRQIEEVSIDGRTPSQQLSAIRDAYMALEQAQQDVWRNLRARLAEKSIQLVSSEAIDGADARWLKDYFVEQIVPVITPQAIDPAHPFPFVAS